MFYSNYFYDFVGFLVALMALAIPLTAQYSNDSLPSLIFGIFYLGIIIMRSARKIFVNPVIRLLVHVIYMTLAVRIAYTSLIHIILLNNTISYIDFVLSILACIIFLIRGLKIFKDNFDHIIHFFH